MMRMIARSLVMILIGVCATAHAADTLVLRGATVYVDAQTTPLRDTNVVVSDGRTSWE